MATPAPSHEFQKLRLNTKHANSSQDFPFAHSSDADHVASSQFSDSGSLSNPVGSDRDERHTRTRGSSVSFKEFATLDDGRLHSLDQPLSSRPPQPRRRSIRDSNMSDDTQTPASAPAAPEEPVRINPFTGEPIRRRTRKSEVAPRLETIDSSDVTHLPSLTSASSGSFLSEQMRSPDTPAGSYFNSSAIMTPSPAASPSIGSEPWPMLSRKPTLSRTASLRNTSRRSSRMSGSSQGMSPAAQFLNGWGSSSIAAEPKPDDEGQPIGINNEYVVGRQIGAGGFSVVKEVIGMDNDGRRTKRAVKIVRKSVANASEAENDKAQQAVDYEIGIWRYLNHPYILQLHTSFITDFATFCIMDLVESGSLYDLLNELRNNGQMGLRPELARTYAHQLASALRYMHADVRLVHRDVKLENCLVQIGPQDDCGNLKLCDFGLASFVDGDSGMADSIRSLDSDDNKDPAGTLEYLAPELLGGSTRKDYSADIWAFGVCVYTMVTGKRPFTHLIQFKLVELIEAGDWNKDLVEASPAGQVASKDICDLLHGCLNTDPDLRWTIADVMDCKWFQGLVDVAADSDWEHVNNTQD
ncbi:kinase-like protein [Aureobasidium subglaciale]|nr:kinase-like protein [Aureobasidium subglaciale]